MRPGLIRVRIVRLSIGVVLRLDRRATLPQPRAPIWCVITLTRSSDHIPDDRTGSAGRRSVANGDLLDGPADAVGIAEVHEPAPGKILQLADLDPAIDELVPRLGGVGDDKLEARDRAGRLVRDPGPDRDRAGGPWRRQLDEAQRVVDVVIVIGIE